MLAPENVMLDVFLYHPLQRDVVLENLQFDIPPGWTGVSVRSTGGQPGRVLFTEMPSVTIRRCTFIRKAA